MLRMALMAQSNSTHPLCPHLFVSETRTPKPKRTTPERTRRTSRRPSRRTSRHRLPPLALAPPRTTSRHWCASQLPLARRTTRPARRQQIRRMHRQALQPPRRRTSPAVHPSRTTSRHPQRRKNLIMRVQSALFPLELHLLWLQQLEEHRLLPLHQPRCSHLGLHQAWANRARLLIQQRVQRRRRLQRQARRMLLWAISRPHPHLALALGLLHRLLPSHSPLHHPPLPLHLPRQRLLPLNPFSARRRLL